MTTDYLIPAPDRDVEPFYGSTSYYMTPHYTNGRYFYAPPAYYSYNINYVTEPYVEPGYVWSGWGHLPAYPNLEYVKLSDSVPAWVGKLNAVTYHLEKYNHFVPQSMLGENSPTIKMNLVVDDSVITKTRFGDMVYPEGVLLQYVGQDSVGNDVWDDFGIINTESIELFRVDPFLTLPEFTQVDGINGYMTVHGFKRPDEMVAITPLLFPEFQENTLIEVREIS